MRETQLGSFVIRVSPKKTREFMDFEKFQQPLSLLLHTLQLST